MGSHLYFAKFVFLRTTIELPFTCDITSRLYIYVSGEKSGRPIF